MWSRRSPTRTLPPPYNWCGTPPTPKHTHTHTHTHSTNGLRGRDSELWVWGRGPMYATRLPPQLLHVTPKAPQNPQNLHPGGPNASLQSSLLTRPARDGAPKSSFLKLIQHPASHLSVWLLVFSVVTKIVHAHPTTPVQLVWDHSIKDDPQRAPASDSPFRLYR